MFVQTIDDQLVNSKYITNIYDENDFICCRLIDGYCHKLYWSDKIDYDMKQKLASLLSAKKYNKSIYHQIELNHDMF